MYELLLHFAWKNRLLATDHYTACTGESVEIVSPGMHNSDGGPDFTHARIRIDDTLWAGNIELHLHASDWEKHKHHLDPAYNNVILHAVYENDRICHTQSGRRIPTIALQIRNPIEDQYIRLLQNSDPIRCRHYLKHLDTTLMRYWLGTLSIERLGLKTGQILEQVKTLKNNWEEAFYINLAKNFGLRINTLPFELLAKSLPLNILSKHRMNLFQLEALLFGQSGFLQQQYHDDYFKRLRKEYHYLQSKYKLRPIPSSIWKFMRLRPANFPTLRIAQLAALLHQSDKLFMATMHMNSIEEIFTTYVPEVSEYWKKHYTFDRSAQKSSPGNMGKASVILLILNAIIPFKFAYAKRKNHAGMKENSLALLENLPPENNRTMKIWKEAGLLPLNASDSQALLQLTNNYCRELRCLKCQIGNLIITTGF